MKCSETLPKPVWYLEGSINLCPRGDSNPHTFRYNDLNVARLPFRHPGRVAHTVPRMRLVALPTSKLLPCREGYMARFRAVRPWFTFTGESRLPSPSTRSDQLKQNTTATRDSVRRAFMRILGPNLGAHRRAVVSSVRRLLSSRSTGLEPVSFILEQAAGIEPAH